MSQTIGIALTSALKSGFLTQACLLFTPLLARLQGHHIGRLGWAACFASLVGTCLIVLDNTRNDADNADTGAQLLGDAFVLAAALMYSMLTVRVSYYVRLVPLTVFAAARLAGLALFSVALLVVKAVSEALRSQQSILDVLHTFWPDVWNVRVWLLMVFLALGGSVAGAILQAQAQVHVQVHIVQLIYGTVPIWSAACSVLLV